MRFLGSAMRFPHVQGGFRESLVMDESQMVAVASQVSMSEAAMAEPLAVCLHAVSRAGALPGPAGSRDRLLTDRSARDHRRQARGRHRHRGHGHPRISAGDGAQGGRRCGHRCRRRTGGAGTIGRRGGRFDVVFEASGTAAARGQRSIGFTQAASWFSLVSAATSLCRSTPS
jgi:hypothetical protein